MRAIQNRRPSETLDLRSPEPQPQSTSLPQPLNSFPNQSTPQASSSSRQQQQDLGGYPNSNQRSQNQGLQPGFKPFSLPGVTHSRGGPGPARVKPKQFESRNQREETRNAPAPPNSSLRVNRPIQVHHSASAPPPKGPRAWKDHHQPPVHSEISQAEQYRLSVEAKNRQKPRQSLPNHSQSSQNQPRPDNSRRHSSSYSQYSDQDRNRRDHSRESSRRLDDRNENDYSHEPERGGGGHNPSHSTQAVVDNLLQILQEQNPDPLASSTSSNGQTLHFPYALSLLFRFARQSSIG